MFRTDGYGPSYGGGTVSTVSSGPMNMGYVRDNYRVTVVLIVPEQDICPMYIPR